LSEEEALLVEANLNKLSQHVLEKQARWVSTRVSLRVLCKTYLNQSLLRINLSIQKP
jgi:hypothetical protein